MKYFFILIVSLVGQFLNIQASVSQEEAKKEICVVDGGSEEVRSLYSVVFDLNNYKTYQDKKLLNDFINLYNSINPELVIIYKNCSVLWALNAWRKLVAKESGVQRLEKEVYIADAIKKSFLENNAGLNSVYISYEKEKYEGWNKRGRHIFYLLFTIAKYSPVMHELWRTIGASLDPELLEYSDKKTEKFSDIVFKSLVDTDPLIRSDAKAALSFLWEYNFLPTQWMNNLQSTISQEYATVDEKLRSLLASSLDSPCRAKDRQGKKKSKKARQREKKKLRSLHGITHLADTYLNQLLGRTYQEKLFNKITHSQLVDAAINTQD